MLFVPGQVALSYIASARTLPIINAFLSRAGGFDIQNPIFFALQLVVVNEKCLKLFDEILTQIIDVFGSGNDFRTSRMVRLRFWCLVCFEIAQIEGRESSAR